MQGPYGWLAGFVLANRRVVWGVLLAVVVGCGWVGLPPRVESNLLALMPEDEPSAQALRQLEDEEGGVNTVTLAFRCEEEEALESFLDALVIELEGLDRVRFAFHEVDEDLAFQLGLMQLRKSDVDELVVRMKGALALGPALNPIVTQRLMDMGPVTERIAGAETIAGLGREPGRGRVLVRPTGPSSDQAFAVQVMGDIEGTLDTLLAAHPAVRLVWVGGAYRHIVEDLDGIQDDLLYTSIVSAALVLVIMIGAFRSWRVVVVVFVPLACANVVNLGLARVLLGGLNTYTSMGTAILIGLGIDFAVHLVGRYREYRVDRTLEDAITAAWDRTGPPCTTAALTSAAGFLALGAASFQGFSQLGVLLATGLVVCLLFMLVMLPLLIAALDGDPPVPFALSGGPAPRSTASYALAPIGLMIAVLFTGLIGASKLPDLEWEFDISSLRRNGLAYAELSEAQREVVAESFSPEVVLYASRRALNRDQRRLTRLIDNEELTHVAGVASVETLLPRNQGERLEALEALQGLLSHPNLRYLPPPLIQQLLPLRGHKLRMLRRRDLPAPLLSLVGAEKRGNVRMLLFPRGNMWDMREARALADEVDRVLPGRVVAGEHISLGALHRMVMRDLPVVALLALLMVTLITAIDLRKAHWLAGAMGTLVAGMIWAGSAVQMAGVKLSLMNIVGLPILLGIGVDVVIHLFHRLKEEGPGGVRRALRTTGVAATISTVTTVASFVSLMVAGNRGIQSLGILVVIGLTTVFVASAVLLPLGWAAGWKVSGRAPADTARPALPREWTEEG